MLSNQMYNVLKYTVTTVLPALGTLYFAIAQIWGVPFGEQVVGTLTALALFGGTLLGLSTRAYNKAGGDTQGTIYIDTTDESKDVYNLELNDSPETLKDLSKVSFKVTSQK